MDHKNSDPGIIKVNCGENDDKEEDHENSDSQFQMEMDEGEMDPSEVVNMENQNGPVTAKVDLPVPDAENNGMDSSGLFSVDSVDYPDETSSSEEQMSPPDTHLFESSGNKSLNTAKSGTSASTLVDEAFSYKPDCTDASPETRSLTPKEVDAKDSDKGSVSPRDGDSQTPRHKDPISVRRMVDRKISLLTGLKLEGLESPSHKSYSHIFDIRNEVLSAGSDVTAGAILHSFKAAAAAAEEEVEANPEPAQNITNAETPSTIEHQGFGIDSQSISTDNASVKESESSKTQDVPVSPVSQSFKGFPRTSPIPIQSKSGIDHHHTQQGSKCGTPRDHCRHYGSSVGITASDHPSVRETDSLLTHSVIGDVSNIEDMIMLDNLVEQGTDTDSDISDPFNLDYNQATVRSIGGISTDTQDSNRYNDAPFPCGNIKFLSSSTTVEEHSKKHYVVVPHDVVAANIAQFMGYYWKMRSPKVIVSVISGVKHFKPWKSDRLREQFQKGLMKAANRTEMWIITSGIDGGVSKLVGDAVREEKSRRASTLNTFHKIDHVQHFKRLTLIGVAPKSGIKYGNLLDGSEGVSIRNEGYQPKMQQYELNPDHTHFVFVEDDKDADKLHFTSIRFALEKQLELEIGRPRRLRKMFSFGSDSEEENDAAFFPPMKKKISVIGLLVQGSPKSVDHVLMYLRSQTPVVVMKGSGGLADILAFAFEEYTDRTDPDVVNVFLKPELIKYISSVFPSEFKENDFARNLFRDKILDCILAAQEGDQTFLSVVNMAVRDADLKDLDKYLLKALLMSEKQSVTRWKEQLHKDLQLLLDWNQPELAQTEIFYKNEACRIKFNKALLEQALMKNDREKFVEMFLEQGMQVHKFLNHKKFKLLFERSDDRDFLYSICLQGVLGKNITIDQSLPNDFLANDLNRLIYILTGLKNFIQPYEMSMNSVGLYVLDPAVAERKALNCLILWAVLMNRHKLAKVLWQKCDEPIALALICSNIYRALSKFCIELYLKTEMEKHADDFGRTALGVLDISYNDSSAQAYNILSISLPDFNNKTTIEIAHDAGYIHFIAHPCCQKWLTKKLFGHIKIKELSWGVFRMPYWFKILASVLLIIPMYIWISYSTSDKKHKVKKTTIQDVCSELDMKEESSSSDSSEDNSLNDDNIPATKSMLENEMKKMKKRQSVSVKLKTAFGKRKKKLSFFKKIYMLWSAPITKFWLTQMFYFVYLGLFCLAVLWPTCGNIVIDIIVWFWTTVILAELVRRTYVKHQKYKALSLFGHCVEIILILIFLILYLFLRIMPYWLNYADINAAKTVLCMGLIYFFYRLLGTYLPISPTLGPMLVRMIRMVKYDFVAFIRMFLIFLISGGVTIQAVLYPNYPLGIELIKRVLTRPLFGMFLTQIDDLNGDPACKPYYANITASYCAASTAGGYNYYEDPVIKRLQKCPYESFSGYIIVIQYLLICKLVLVTLLFAMFALTITKVDMEASEIWKYQRYALIIDFEEKPCLPPPLTIVTYLYLLGRFLYQKIRGCNQKYRAQCFRSRNKKETDAKEDMKHRVQRLKRSDDFTYWKKCATEYVAAQELKKNEEFIQQKQTDIIRSIQDDMKLHKKNMKRMNNRLVELERILMSSRLYLENIYHKLDRSDVLGVASIKGQILHVAARQSPYPETSIARFPVFDKYVPWETPYDVYDPKTFTKEKDQFSEDERVFVDEDLIILQKIKLERNMMSEAEKDGLPKLPVFVPKWNSVVTYKKGYTTRSVDRRSWITTDNQPLRYALDPLGLPLNPNGRTGIRGRGILWRWGPNHVIKAVCTRWRCKMGDSEEKSYLYIEGKRMLEFIAVKKQGDQGENVYGLPGGALHGLISPYSTLCLSFTKDVLDDQEGDCGSSLGQADMIQFFAQFAVMNPGKNINITSPSISASQILPLVSGSSTSLRTDGDTQGYSVSLLYKGYVDDPRNTDNAWVEAEVWNFHYDNEECFDSCIPEFGSAAWKEVSPSVKLFGNEGAIVQEVAKIHDAYH